MSNYYIMYTVLLERALASLWTVEGGGNVFIYNVIIIRKTNKTKKKKKPPWRGVAVCGRRTFA